MEVETKADGDDRPTVGRTRVAEGGEIQETQKRGGSLELGMELVGSQRQPEKEEGGTKEPRGVQGDHITMGTKTCTRTREHK